MGRESRVGRARRRPTIEGLISEHTRSPAR
jgi:hypothetical protein